MGKYKHKGIGRNISISGGRERADLFKDMSGGYNAMGDSNDPSPLYNYGGNSVAKRYSKGPLELTAEGKKKILASSANPEFKSAIAKQPVEMKGSHSPMYKSSCTSGGSSRSPYKAIGDPNKKMDRLSAKHKALYDRFEMGQTSEAEEQKMYRLEDRMDKVGKKIKKSKKSPLNQGFDGDKALKTLPGGNYPKPPISGRNPNYKPGVKADEDRTKKDKRKHKRTMKKLGRLTKKIVLKSTSKK